ncbi:hypothetical protein ARTHRO9AX_220229 [Arthrobacter sp. 9AX]|nr:hypothetical protein ARTHRO9AX_220229 [Arthrobacter sp. 9AX]
MTRRPSPWKNLLGGGTRCPTSPTKSGPPASLTTSPPAHAGPEPKPTRTSTLPDRTCSPPRLADLHITQVHTWLTDPTDDAAVPILMEAGFYPDRQRRPRCHQPTRQTTRRHLRHRSADGLLPDQPASLPVGDLSAFPRGRAIMFASGAPAALLETVPWMGKSTTPRSWPPSQPTTPPIGQRRLPLLLKQRIHGLSRNIQQERSR